jgi:hypothetical protein
MTADNYSLDDIIREFHKEFKEYLKKAGIEIEGVRLRVLESPNLLKELYHMIKTYDIYKLKQELNTIDKSLLEKISNDDIYIINKENLREFYIHEIYLLGQIFNTDNINELNNKILKYIVNRIVYHTENNELVDGIGVPETKEIYIIKDRLKERIDETLNRLGSININGSSIIRLKLPLSDVIYIPLYTEGKNIKEDIAKAYAGNIIIHEAGHHIVDRKKQDDGEFSASALQYIMYIDMHDLLKYPETYKIIKENIQECKEYVGMLAMLGYHTAIGDFQEDLLKYVVNVLKRAPYELGECYANIIIDRNKNLNIKDIVEEVKNLSPLNVINKIIFY